LAFKRNGEWYVDDWNGQDSKGEVAVLRIKWRLDLYISDIFVLIE